MLIGLRNNLILLTFFIFLISIPFSCAIVINEIELNPAGTDKGNEWLELYSEQEVNLSESKWKLMNADNDTLDLNGTINGYLIIQFPFQWLDNSDEKVILLNENTTIDETPFLSDTLNNNYTWNLCGEWVFTNATKGSENNCQDQEESNPNSTSEETTPLPETHSTIKIEDAPNEAEFGETIKIKISIYKGDTSKYAVYAYIEGDERISEKTTLHVKTKFTNYEMTIPVQLKPNCNGKYEDGEYTLILEGLDEKETREINIEGIKSSLCDLQESETRQKDTNSKIEYNITLPRSIEIGKEFPIKINIVNGKQKDVNLKLWSYVYRSSKCYSYNGTRESNAKQVNVKSHFSTEVELINKVLQADEGEYKLKVKILESNLKTPKEFTFDIVLKKPEEKTINEAQTTQTKTEPSITGRTTQAVYLANTKIIKNLGLWILIITAILLLIVIWKKKLV